MLDDAEFAVITQLDTHIPLKDRLIEILERYNRITGYSETNPNAVWHHRLSLYGPPCKNCSRPLRTPRAKLCGSCMTTREVEV